MSRKLAISLDPKLRTVSSETLLVDGSDAAFRKMLYTMRAIENAVEAIREGFAKIIGITGPQHELLMLIYRFNEGEGVGVGELAAIVNLTSAFVATETNKLSASGFIEKRPHEIDRRRVILRVTREGREKLALLSGYQRQVNDALFGCFDAKDFRKFAQYLDEILPCSERALRLISKLGREATRTGDSASAPTKRSRKAAGH